MFKFRPALLSSRKAKFFISAFVVIVGLIGFGALGVWYTLFRVISGPYDAPGVSPEEYFKYGSIGAEQRIGIPYWIWLALPEIFPEHLPDRPGEGYARVGMVWEEGRDMPIGVPKKDIGIVPRAGINCAICHTSTYKVTTGEDNPTIVLGGVSQRFDLLGYQRFLFAAASDERFTSDTILDAINEINELSWFEKLLYRYVIIPRTKDALLDNKEDWDWTYRNPDWGPGRIDPFNPAKFDLLEQPVDATIGNSDMMSLWNLKNREGKALHWDGLNRSITEVILSSAIGDGATAKSLDLRIMQRIENYLRDLPPPEYPFDVDENLVSEGMIVFDNNCASCHTPGQDRTGQVIPITEVGTDRHRMDMWAAKDAEAYMDKYKDYEWGFEAFQDPDGYVAVPLDGLWLRAPYLHNGSVPTLIDLLENPESRPKTFYRGYDVYDPEKVGFVSDVEENEQGNFFRFDTMLPGNSNEGHLYGTNLSAADKRALVEYLKTK